MTFHVSKKKNTILLITLSFLIVGVSVALFFCSSDELDLRASSILSMGYGLFLIYQVIRDYQATITVDEQKISMFRRGKTSDLYWNEVRKIEFKGLKGLPFSDTIIIHSAREKLYVDYTFEAYKECWELLKSYAEKNKSIIILEK